MLARSSTADRSWLARAAAVSLAGTALALARFGYSALLPGMRSDLHWSYAQAGAMNTANGLGYLAGALAAAPILGVLRERRTFVGSFALTGLSLLASGLTGNYLLLLCLRAVAGGAGAVLFIAGGTLATHLASRSPSPGLVLGIYFAGVGPGILVSALLVPTILGTAEGWRTGWIVMGLVTVACLLPASWALPAISVVPAPAQHEPPRVGQLRWSLAAFFLFGLGYISYMTFILAYYHALGRTDAELTLFWALLAFASVASAWVWRSLLDRSRGGQALVTLLVVLTAGATLPLLSDTLLAMVLSAILFGGTFLSVIAAMTVLMRKALLPHQWALGMTVSTTVFAVGQTAGPLIAGALADRSGGLQQGLVACTVLLAVAAGLASRQPIVGLTGRPT